MHGKAGDKCPTTASGRSLRQFGGCIEGDMAMNSGSRNEKLNNWVKEVADLCQPDSITWCDGSKKEYDRMMTLLQERGMGIPLKRRPNSFLFRTDPSDVARVEDRTYTSTRS